MSNTVELGRRKRKAARISPLISQPAPEPFPCAAATAISRNDSAAWLRLEERTVDISGSALLSQRYRWEPFPARSGARAWLSISAIRTSLADSRPDTELQYPDSARNRKTRGLGIATRPTSDE